MCIFKELEISKSQSDLNSFSKKNSSSVGLREMIKEEPKPTTLIELINNSSSLPSISRPGGNNLNAPTQLQPHSLQTSSANPFDASRHQNFPVHELFHNHQPNQMNVNEMINHHPLVEHKSQPLSQPKHLTIDPMESNKTIDDLLAQDHQTDPLLTNVDLLDDNFMDILS